MLLLLAAATIAPLSPDTPSITRTGAVVQARATVRIVRAVTLRLGQGPLQGDAPVAQKTVVHTDTGPHPASLIEFQ